MPRQTRPSTSRTASALGSARSLSSHHRAATSDVPVTATLTVTDPAGLQGTASTTLRPGNHAPTLSIDSPSAGQTFRVGQVVTLRGSATDPVTGSSNTKEATRSGRRW